jgi:predicted transcriptional regulator YheO
MPAKKLEQSSAVGRHEEASTLRTLTEVAPAIAEVFGNQCEVVVHDLRKPERSIVSISNGHVSGRTLGGPLIGGPFNDLALKWLTEYGETTKLQVYETRTRDGKRLRSGTILFRDERRKPIAALCINFDITNVAQTSQWLLGLLHFATTPGPNVDDTTGSGQSKGVPSNGDVDEVLQTMIEESLVAVGLEGTKPNREQRFAVVDQLDARGVFLIKGAVQRVATTLGVSKFTIYNDLEAIRGK